MRLYHGTDAELADLIIEGGFEDRSMIDGGRSNPDQRRGTWFSDGPQDPEFEYMPGRKGSVLCVDLPESVALQFRVTERYGLDDFEGHEYLVPAAVLNQYRVERIEQSV
jgi:hypothetical protein